ncbi:putative sulfate transport system permease protein cysT [Saliniradius amylolyticus]|uniref:Putative sulfate transport system permease protein cysT n=1 Tax=Saliniradius amylolyticus TaxID=2183582 RepID=A0A2S2E529_9ALTE|nr:iron ABC transporter permease [Saliniradius amylolyticus]AWL12340.1 putative sulfate transport system permease protein cysT [Saliniradius amylolyticus]
MTDRIFSFKNALTDGWRIAVWVPAFVLALPVLVVLSSVADPQWQLWQHLTDTVLSSYVVNSLLLALGVGLGTMTIGTGLAWLCHHFEFPGRRQFEWLLLLPMAMPAYIIAYSYTGFLDFAGPVQSLLRSLFDWQYGDYYFPEIRSLGGAIVMLTLVLYPYVFMLARNGFREQSLSLYEVSQALGMGPVATFFKVAVPMARPAILTGVALAMMEAFADYGTVQYFGVSTFTTGIFRTWFGMGNSVGAAQLAALLTGFVFILLILEKYSRRKIRYYYQGHKQITARRQRVRGAWAGFLFACCALPLTLGFILPVLMLSHWVFYTGFEQFDSEFIGLMGNSFLLAGVTAMVVLLLALLFSYGKRLRPNSRIRWPINTASLGYAVPGTVIAVGCLLPLSWLDHRIHGLMASWFGIQTGLIFSGTLFALVLAYSIRFLAVSLHQIDTGLERIRPSMDQAGRSLGLSPIGILKRIHLPILRPSVLAALLLVFVDVLKELPATLILRPFNFDTLAVKAYELASDERLADAALPSLAILVVGVLPVIWLSRAIEATRKGYQ